MPVRKVRSHGRNVIGDFPSLKNERMVAYESTIERDFCYYLDYVRNVISFEEQPFKIKYVYDGKELTYTPDFCVQLVDGRTIVVECKLEQFVNASKNQQKFAAGQTHCQLNGWQFVVITDQHLRQNHLTENVRLLTRHARYKIDFATKADIVALLSNHQTMTIGQVMTTLRPEKPKTMIVPLLHLAFHHEVHIPINMGQINVQSPITLEKSHGKGSLFDGTRVYLAQ